MHNVVKYSLENNTVDFENNNVRLSSFLPESFKNLICDIPNDQLYTWCTVFSKK